MRHGAGRNPGSLPIRLTPPVHDALNGNGAVTVLESSVFAQGLPAPVNRTAAAAMYAACERHGSIPAVVAVLDGMPTIGVTDAELEILLGGSQFQKVSARDLPFVIANGLNGATTVAATLAIMRLTDARVFATGGIGGVHRDAPFDESADLNELAHSGGVVVCAGAKSILDLPATLERLETLGVPIIGYRTDEFPAFFSRMSGLQVSARAETISEVCAMVAVHERLGRQQSVLVVQPPPAEFAMEPAEVEEALLEALAESRRCGVRGPATTPFLLTEVSRITNGRSMQTNVALLEENAALAAGISAALRGGA